MPDIEKELTRELTEEELSRFKRGTKRRILSNVTTWVHRLKMNTKFKYFYLTGMITASALLLIMFGMEYFTSEVFISDTIIYVAFFFCLYLGKKITTEYEELLLTSEKIFGDEQKYESFIKHVNDIFRSKLELFLPLLAGVAYGMAFFYLGSEANFTVFQISGRTLHFAEGSIQQIFKIIQMSIVLVIFSCVIMLVMSTLLTLYLTFKSINDMGTDEFQLTVTYKDLKIGAFNEIGKFIISISIPTIILSTIISILGAIVAIIYNNTIVGIFYMGLGLYVVIATSVLLYSNTVHIHNSITQYKRTLSNKIIDKVQFILNRPPFEIDYDTIFEIHQFYHDVVEISDWPFNPTSIKKLVITLGSSLLPIVFSFTQLGFGG